MPPPMTRKDWLVPAGLVLLALVPVIAGAVRLQDLASGASTPASSRFHDNPVPVAIHIVSATWFALAGAFQFAPALRRRNRWHRWSGRSVGPMGVFAALSGIWMTLVYPWANADGEAVFVARLIFGTGMAVALVLGVTTILKGDIAAHKAWMLRAYAIGMAAGTQVFTHLPWFILVGQPTEGPRAVMMIGAWMINLAIAEWLIARETRRRAGPSPTRRQCLKPS